MKIGKPLMVVLCFSSIILIILDCFIIYKVRKDSQTMSDYSLTLSHNAENTTNTTNTTDTSTSEKDFYYEPLSEDIIHKISGVSFTENDTISLDDLRHVVVKYVDFENNTRTGELIVNKAVADDVVDIFKELYDASYQIEKIRLIDEYNGSDDASMEDNNSSAFNYRNIDGTNELSDHSLGLAIDINPLYNPYVRTGMGDRDILPVNATMYADRAADFSHKIQKGDVCYNAFISRGWKWGGDWSSPIDYQHFYKTT